MNKNTSHAPHAGISGVSAAPKNASKTAPKAASDKPPVNGQTASDISKDQVFSKLFEGAQQDVLESKVYANWRAEIKASIRLNETLKESTPEIVPKNLAIPTYDAMVDIYSCEHLSTTFDQMVMLNADEHKRRAIIEGVAQATVSDLREIKQKEKKEKERKEKKRKEREEKKQQKEQKEQKGQKEQKERARKEVVAIIEARREQFGCRIESAISEVETETRYLLQSLVWIATCPNEADREAAREMAVKRFWAAIGRVRSEAEVALTKFEGDRDNAAGLVRISQLRAIRELPPLVIPERGLKTKDFAARFGLVNATIGYHFRTAVAEATADWMNTGNLKLTDTGQWHIREQWVAEAFDEYIKVKWRQRLCE